MSVHQVEEFYLHVDTSDKVVEVGKMQKMLQDNNWDDYEIADSHIVVDGFESEDDACHCEELIMEILEQD